MLVRLFEFGPLAVWAALLFAFVRPLRLGRVRSCVLGIILLAASQKFLIYRIFGGNSFVPDLPERFVNFTGWAYSTCMLLFAGVCAWWTVHASFRLAQRAALWRKKRGRADAESGVLATSAARRAFLSMPIAAACVAGWGIWEGVRVPRVHEFDVRVKGLPAAFDGFRIVHLTDLHCSPAARITRTRGIVDAVNALDADLVCITGDFVDGSPEQRMDDMRPLALLRARHGVLGCAGNHEYYHDYAKWRPMFESLGITMLDNAHRMISHNGATIAVGGVTDFVAPHNMRRAMEGPDVAKAFAAVPANTCRILLQHQPKRAVANDAWDVRLQLSGHTHGGAILGFDLLVKRMNEGLVRGLYRMGRLALYVNSGTGQWAGFPLRLGVPAEIAVLRLRPE
jgi:predicted MPP superfamily phosphohydrolase